MRTQAKQEYPEHREDESKVASGPESQATDTQQSDDTVAPKRKVGPVALAHRSTGPRTPQGKENSKHNALKHGIFSKLVVLPGESRAEFTSLLSGLWEDRRPQGTLEEILVEKMATLLWRYRRFLMAEGAEIQEGSEFLQWDEEHRQAERGNEISAYSIQQSGGLIRRIENPKVLERCLELLKELEEGIKERGFDPDSDSVILTKLYGAKSEEGWQQTLIHPFQNWSLIASFSEEQRKQADFPSPKECEGQFLLRLKAEIRKLTRYQKTRAERETKRTKLEARRRSVPDSHGSDRLQRYEAGLERTIERTLSQLERLQRMRMGQPVLPPMKLDISS